MLKSEYSICQSILLTFVLFLYCSAETISLPGPRQVKAELTQKKDVWHVSLRMRPVQCFDQVTNREVTKKLGCDYALEAISKMLKAENLAVRFCHCDAIHQENDAVVLQVRAGGIRPVTLKSTTESAGDRSSISKATSSKMTFSATHGSLFSCESDWMRIIDSFCKSVLDECRHGFENVTLGDSTVVFLGTCEKKLNDGIKAIMKQVKEDIALLSTERENLQRECDKAVGETIANMARFGELLGTADGFQNVTTSYECDPELMIAALKVIENDVKVVHLGDGRRAVVSVGATEIRDSKGDIVRQMKAAQIRAYDNLVKWTQSHVKTKSVLSESHSVRIKKDGTREETYDESLVVITKEEAKGIVRGQKNLGTWVSKDGLCFCHAIGVFF